MRNVITYQAPNGETLTICSQCERDRAGDWPRNARGEEYATVSHGRHLGRCDLCEGDDR